jgi:hypothetical protein
LTDAVVGRILGIGVVPEPFMSPRALLLVLLSITAPAVRGDAQTYLEPTRIQGTDAQKNATVQRLRDFIYRYTWGGGHDVPRGVVPALVKDTGSPIRGLRNLARTQTLMTNVEGVQGLAFHLIPAKNKKNYLVVIHHGHACSFDDDSASPPTHYGMKRTIQDLLDRGYSVLAAHMPNMIPTNCQSGDTHGAHGNLSMKVFLEPLARHLNYLEKEFPEYGIGTRGVAMAGLSGGGWMATIYPAIDQRVKRSFPVSGSMPLSLRGESSMGDNEQWVHEFYKEVNYLDLYVMAAWNGRRHTQILNAKDDCCFGEGPGQFRSPARGIGYQDALTSPRYGYEGRVTRSLGAQGSYRLHIDRTSTGHVISPSATEMIINGL